MYPLPSHTVVRTADECLRYGREIAYRTQRNDVIALCGALGAGKTTLATGIIAGLGIADAVQSQTFTIIRSYGGSVVVHHIDLYRVRAVDLPELGIEELLANDHVAIVEWAERAAAWLPPATTWINLTVQSDNARMVAAGDAATAGIGNGATD